MTSARRSEGCFSFLSWAFKDVMESEQSYQAQVEWLVDCPAALDVEERCAAKLDGWHRWIALRVWFQQNRSLSTAKDTDCIMRNIVLKSASTIWLEIVEEARHVPSFMASLVHSYLLPTISLCRLQKKSSWGCCSHPIFFDIYLACLICIATSSASGRCNSGLPGQAGDPVSSSCTPCGIDWFIYLFYFFDIWKGVVMCHGHCRSLYRNHAILLDTIPPAQKKLYISQGRQVQYKLVNWQTLEGKSHDKGVACLETRLQIACKSLCLREKLLKSWIDLKKQSQCA